MRESEEREGGEKKIELLRLWAFIFFFFDLFFEKASKTALD